MNQTPPHEAVDELAPSGSLRAGINYGNPVLVRRDAGSGALSGLTIDLTHEIARRLGVEPVLVPFDAAGGVVTAIKDGVCDLGFLAIDPQRAEELHFTAPYVIIEGGYLVRSDSPLRSLDDVDARGVRVAVGRNAAYDLFLSRSLTRATIVRGSTSGEAIEMFLHGETDVAAGIRSVLVDEAARLPDLRVLDGAFMTIRQAAATRRGREHAARYLDTLIEELKASGFIAAAIERSGRTDATPAPPAEATA